MCLHCLTHDLSTDLMTAEAALKLIPRHWEAYLTPVSLLAESTGASYFMNRGNKIRTRRTMYAFSKHKIIAFVSLCLFPFSSMILFLYFLSVKAAGSLLWEQCFAHIKGRAICTHHFYLQQLDCSCFQGDFFAKYSHRFLFIGSNNDSAETLASYVWEPGGSRLAFITLTHLVFITESGVVFTPPQDPVIFFFFIVKTSMWTMSDKIHFMGVHSAGFHRIMRKETTCCDVSAPV